MCGICGIINFDQAEADEKVIRSMMSGMKHRGPDDEGIFIENSVGLGFVRLSIIDLSEAGHQPMFSGDKRYVIVFNGEIYNYLELRAELKAAGHRFMTNTDTEVLLESWKEWGEEAMHHFNGMWSFVIFDRIEKRVFACRDRFGVKPFYFLRTERSFTFASEIPPLIPVLGRKPTADLKSVYDFLVFNRTDHSEGTFFNEIKKLKHGQSLSFFIDDPGSLIIKNWYNLRERIETSRGFESAAEYLDLFTSSIELRLRSDVPVGVCLSGGLDSSSIVSVLTGKLNKTDLNTFSAIYKRGQTGDETSFIKCFENDVRHMYFTSPGPGMLESDLASFLRTHAEPISSISPYAQYKVMELAKDHVVVTLDGQGADEQLAGYHYFFGFYFKQLLTEFQLGKLSKELFSEIISHKSFFGLKALGYFMLPGQMRTYANEKKRSHLNPVFLETHKDQNIIAENFHGSTSLNDSLINHFEYKLEHLLKWEDRNSMHFSIEARVPFLDFRLVEKSLSSPESYKIRSGDTKFILRESMKGILPEKIRQRRDKIGFDTPANEWFRTLEWQSKFNEIIRSQSFRNREFFKADRSIDLYERHLSGKEDNSRELWKLFHLEMWLREYID